MKNQATIRTAFLTLIMLFACTLLSAQEGALSQANTNVSEETGNYAYTASFDQTALLIDEEAEKEASAYRITYSGDRQYFILSRKNNREKNFHVNFLSPLHMDKRNAVEINSEDNSQLAGAFTNINYDELTRHFGPSIVFGLNPVYRQELYNICRLGHPYKISEYLINGRLFHVKIKTPFSVINIKIDKNGDVVKSRKRERSITEERRMKELVNWDFLKEYEKIEDFGI